jgi:hypothetical protein
VKPIPWSKKTYEKTTREVENVILCDSSDSGYNSPANINSKLQNPIDLEEIKRQKEYKKGLQKLKDDQIRRQTSSNSLPAEPPKTQIMIVTSEDDGGLKNCLSEDSISSDGAEKPNYLENNNYAEEWKKRDQERRRE